MLYYQLSFNFKYNDFPSEAAGIQRLILKLNQHVIRPVFPMAPDAPYALIMHMRAPKISLIACVPPRQDALPRLLTKLKELFLSNGIELDKTEDIREITSREFYELGETAQNNNHCSYRTWRSRELGLSHLSNNIEFTFNEKICPDKLNSAAAVERCKDIMGDTTLREELKRIYSRANKRTFYEHPVHYKITAGSQASAEEMLELLVCALHSNGRLPGSRLVTIADLDYNNHNNDEVDDILASAKGNTVAIFTQGDTTLGGPFAGNYENTIGELAAGIRQHKANTLFVIVELTEKPGFTKALLHKIETFLDLIEINEGLGDRKKALAYLRRLVNKHDVPVTDEELDTMLPFAPEHTAAEVQNIRSKWYANAMKTHIYKAYKSLERHAVEDIALANNAYQELQQMVGLTEVKRMVDEIIDTARMQQLRSEMGLKNLHSSLHACFTGNPGCAKTTVARLLARILKNEGILKTGKYVEVGRSDLVGRYVGWTAKLTERKFREAYGGILFVDECYALADDSNSFGAEAINTLVQLMENYRNDVIVIFAGYPKKVEDFLAKNEGLRSRISFHIHFPDYQPDDLTDILHLMTEEKGYRLADGVDKLVRKTFADACTNEEFGNGRFARTLLEQAIMRQANRLFKDGYTENITREEAELLLPEDFEVNAGKLYKKAGGLPLGFCG